MPTDVQRIQAVFLAAAEISDPPARSGYLAGACGGDAELRSRVEALLHAHDQPDSLLDHPAVAPHQPDAGTTRTIGDEGGAGTADEVPLAFLTPSIRPDSLGRLGHYEVLQVLGRGGFGIVFRAFDEMLQRVVALKVLAPQLAATSPARKRFLREARSSAQVRHENVVQVYEVAERPLPYLAMEFIPGETLQQRLDRVGPVESAEVVRVGRQIAEGLAAAHATDLIHRDIKPGNILLEGGQQRVRITDFGLARAADDASISQSGIIAGTPMYMAPEQTKGEKLDQRADLFSLGSVLYQMASGRPPFRANSSLAALKRVAEDAPRDIREIIPETPQWLCDIITKLHAKNPDDRYQSAREVADVLADCEVQLKANAKLKDYSRIPRGKLQPLGRRKWVVAAAAVLLPVITLAVTEFAGVTDLFRVRESTSDPTRTGPAVTPPPLAVAPFTDADRRAAEYVLSIGGRVRVDGDVRGIQALDELPQGRVRLTYVDLGQNQHVTDTGLVSFQGCKKLTFLNLYRAPVTDAGLANFKDCKGLTVLHLDETQVSDAGLANFKDCTGLETLGLNDTRVSDAGLANFKGFKGLTVLGLNGTRVSDTGLGNFKDCKRLINLDLAGTQVSDAGLAHLKDYKGLKTLGLIGTRVSDAGLADLKDCKRLSTLNLYSTRISDAGLAYLADLDRLTELDLRDTNVTAKGVEDLARVLPKCKITWDGGVIEPPP